MLRCPAALANTPTHSPQSVYEKLRQERSDLLLDKAFGFLDLLDLEPDAPNVSATRRDEIRAAIEATGTYVHLPEELLWGARFAWRHSVRCIGRFFWTQLEVLDARNVQSIEDVAQKCEEHLRLATNGGVVRPLVTVFPARSPAGEYRIWNYQLARYAGYRSDSEQFIGDPAEAAFTALCVRLGWQPPANRSKFDILPLIISGPNQPPKCFPLATEAVLEVPLTHPEFDWFETLALRWYAVPVVSNMLLEIGGINYTAAPFNGWYMGTEIGARNLADADRYNLLPEIAARMGISDRREHTLWRDRVLVELNRAVLHSYQRAGVRMIDHHTAAKLHVRFEEDELAAGRPVTGRWDWLVPPISGAATPLWNRTYDPTEYSPNFFYQQSPWESVTSDPAPHTH
jgi:nitric-oxide synthase